MITQFMFDNHTVVCAYILNYATYLKVHHHQTWGQILRYFYSNVFYLHSMYLYLQILNQK